MENQKSKVNPSIKLRIDPERSPAQRREVEEIKMQKNRSKLKKSVYFGFLIVIFTLSLSKGSFLILSLRSASAQTMSNQNYIIKTEGFNTISGVTAVGDLNPIAPEGVNFKAKTGFENLASIPFSISLSSSLVDFGSLSPTNPVIRTVDLGINSEATYGYSVMVFENKPLKNDKAFIPDTTCDNGRCDAENADEWINVLTYGFGYRCDNIIGADCDSSFANPNFYKHFPDIASNDDPQPIMAGIGSNNKEVRISYKVNISGTQAQGTYNNVITYIAVPNF